ncbi:MAG: universal stress protein [Bacteroidetes bacterium]|nr:universal stress protein [Bacteroidota bacterium]
MKNILVPIDFSEYSKTASAIAEKIAKVTGAEIHYLHTNESKNEHEKLHEKLNSFAPQSKEIKSKAFITDGVPFDDIINHSEEFESDLIIICSSGMESYHSSYATTNVLKITRLANCPVLIIPPNIKEINLDKILFVNDFTYEIDYKEQVERVFQTLVELTKDFKPEINLLYVKQNGIPEEKLEKCMIDFAESFDGMEIGSNIKESESVEDGAIGFAKETGADAICMIGHGSGNYFTELRVSVSEKVIEKADVPVILIKVTN